MRRAWAAALSVTVATGCTGVAPRAPAIAARPDPVLPSPGLADRAAALPRTGFAPPELAHVDQLMARFMAERDVPGGAVALAKAGRLVYARGFGYADVERSEVVRPTSLFRIASLSKPITAVAVLQLAERGRLRLDDPVFDLLGLEPHLPPGAAVDRRVRDITVYHCLTHTAGWDRERTFDPMNETRRIAEELDVPLPVDAADVMRYMLGRPLDFDPGARRAYSSFGFRVLGRVIERVTGEPYAAYVRRHVLAPLGIRRMRLGRSLLADRAPGEVRYYDPDRRTAESVVPPVGTRLPLPYGTYDMELRTSNGGWLASVVDLARFAVAFDDPPTCPILGPETIDVMFARPYGLPDLPADERGGVPYYACGWAVRVWPDGSKAQAHSGALVGVSAWLFRRRDGVDGAVLFNRQTGPSGAWLIRELEPGLRAALAATATWPRGTDFEPYLASPAGVPVETSGRVNQ